ncbi:MAG: M50 family metallopeptidase [Chloroflexota bacterium]
MIGLVQNVVTIAAFFAILGGLVIFHELGHFLTARLARVRVLEFGIGFPPRARVLRAKGETLYTLNWLPIGGFVRLQGEDGDNTDDPRSFSAKSLPVRLGILAAGVAMNLLLAFAIFTGIAWLVSPYVGATVDVVDPSSPAAQAGIQPGDAVIAVDGDRYQFLVGPTILDGLRGRAGRTASVTVEAADGRRRDVTVALRSAADVEAGRGALGIRARDAKFFGEYGTNDLATAASVGWDQTVHWLGAVVGGLGSLVQHVATDPTAPPPVSGPVGIATQIGEVLWKAGPVMTLYVAGILSANLALVNILPFPPLDGGRMLMITLKRFLGSRISLRAEQLTYMVGFVVLFAFIIWVTGFDIARGLGAGT